MPYVSIYDCSLMCIKKMNEPSPSYDPNVVEFGCPCDEDDGGGSDAYQQSALYNHSASMTSDSELRRSNGTQDEVSQVLRRTSEITADVDEFDLSENYQNAVDCLISCEAIIKQLSDELEAKDLCVRRLEREGERMKKSMKENASKEKIDALRTELAEKDERISSLEEKVVEMPRLEEKLVQMSLELALTKAQLDTLRAQGPAGHFVASGEGKGPMGNATSSTRSTWSSTSESVEDIDESTAVNSTVSNHDDIPQGKKFELNLVTGLCVQSAHLYSHQRCAPSSRQ